MRGLFLSVLLLLAPIAGAQDAYQELGVDPAGDAQANGVPMLDTWIDINRMAVDTVDTDLVFWLGLEGDTTEAGSYCWMAAFEFNGAEFVGLDCYEGVAYENDNTLSTANPPATSRGTNVASSVVFEGGAAKITVPLSAIGANIGDTIDDIYGLTYASRLLVVADTIPDAKRSAGADESLGSYVIGGAPLVVEEPEVPVDLNETIEINVTLETITGSTDGNLSLVLVNETSTHIYNWTGPANATSLLSFNGTGNFSLRVTAGNMTLHNQSYTGLGNETLVLAGMGNATLEFVFDAFTGTIVLSPAPVTESNDGSVEESPVPLTALLVALGVVAHLRKRRT